MGIINEQWAFLKDVAKLIEYAEQEGFLLTGGELFRTLEQQKIHVTNGNSKTMNSAHMTRLAIDFNIFFDLDEDGDYDLVERTEDVKRVASKLGTYWCGLSKKNLWGFSAWGWDAPHFERRL
jgi:peptidoglycan L-alanyl-D-glutamate endopeptidase CwlK